MKHDIGNSILQPLLVRIGSGDFAITRFVAHSLDHCLGNRSATWSKRAIGQIDSGSAAASAAFWYYFDLIGDGVLGALAIRIGARNLAVRRLVVDPLNTSDGYGRMGFRAGFLARTFMAAFGRIREVLVLVALGRCCSCC